MIRINNLSMNVSFEEEQLRKKAAKLLRVRPDSISRMELVKQSIDARKKSDVHMVLALNVEVSGEADVVKRCRSNNVSLLPQWRYQFPKVTRNSTCPPVVVGMGPAGLFAALYLARSGVPSIVLERGKPVEERTADVEAFWRTGILNTASNVQFGEGGAGTFSDGKLTTGIKDPLCRQVFIDFVEFGANEDILYSWLPHIGTDKLCSIVKNIRKEIIRLGGEVRFNCQLTDIFAFNGVIQGVSYTDENGEKHDIETDALILAVGHSARDTVEMLYNKGIKMMQKPFSVGARIEHPREMIDKAQYGSYAGHPALGAASYKLSCHPQGGRGAYTFCMCPGGTVVAAASEENTVVVNGMSYHARDGRNSNSALLVGVEPEDFGSDHPLAGFDLQHEIEHKAFIEGGANYSAPAQLVGDFLKDRPSEALGDIEPTCPTGVKLGNIRKTLPKKVTDIMADALVKMGTQLKGFDRPDAVLTAPETRSSSPVRILRDEYYQSVSLRGLYPCGEGAGYAGGIVSSAVDGIRCANAVLSGEYLNWFTTDT